MDPTMLAGLGAFLSGAGSVLGAIFVIRGMRKRMRADCEERLELFRQGINVGAKIEEK